MERPELGFSLNKSGTGTAQIIAILTVMMTFEQAVIVIDEISSFLHPAAVKALLRIIQSDYLHHQYIITTHSPDVISSANPSTVYLIRRQGYDLIIQSVNLGQVEELQLVADQLGISMTDVFAAERLIWVEGPTEELCFPFVYEEARQGLPRGTLFTAVVNTGDFQSKSARRRELVIEIYQRLSSAASPLVKSVYFSFDREEMDETEIRDLKRSANERLDVLPRRHFECFLLNPNAIASFLTDQVSNLGSNVSADTVLASLVAHGGEAKFGARDEWDGDIRNEAWCAKCAYPVNAHTYYILSRPTRRYPVDTHR